MPGRGKLQSLKDKGFGGEGKGSSLYHQPLQSGPMNLDYVNHDPQVRAS